jgi:RNA polymerase sigma factor (sigma-70 family)
MGISATATTHRKETTRGFGWPGRDRRPRRLHGLQVRVSEVDDLPIPYFEKPGRLWTAEQTDDFFEWPFHRPQQRELVLLMAANVRRRTAFQVHLNDIEVVMQETWLARQARIARYDPARGRPMRWVLRGMCFRLRDRVRTRGRQEAIVGELPADADLTPATGDLSAAERELIRAMDGGRRSALVRTCIERLKPTYREVLLCDLEEMDQREAAGVLGITTALVRQRRRRARKALTKILPEGLDQESPF